jgi:hypothetical protein
MPDPTGPSTTKNSDTLVKREGCQRYFSCVLQTRAKKHDAAADSKEWHPQVSEPS